MSLEGKYVEDGRCAICGRDWPHIHTLEEAFLYEARRFGALMREQVYENVHPDSASFRAGQDVGKRQERSRIRKDLLNQILPTSGFLEVLDRILPEEGDEERGGARWIDGSLRCSDGPLHEAVKYLYCRLCGAGLKG
jgi:hypothetical protein